ncbi:MAG: acyl-[acyl-carrier-protein] thioesterase [Christensenellales bacterium]|jgi:medium-chain acyl-[acyl-carrier-protein] hydrolase
MNTASIDVTLRSRDVDYAGRWRMSEMFIAMQELGELHCSRLGYARSQLIQKGLIWVLTRVKVEAKRYPKLGDNINITTWPGKTKKTVFPRFYLANDSNGSLLGAHTLWMLVDAKTHQMAMPSKHGVVVEAAPDLEPTAAYPGRLSLKGDVLRREKRRVCYSDLDINRHMNNTRYVEWIYDIIDCKDFDGAAFSDFQINYLNEARAGDEISLESRRDGDNIYVHGAKGDVPVFDACARFAKPAPAV